MISEPEKIADITAKKIMEIMGRPAPVRKIRNSQLLSAIMGTVGFALFINGTGELFSNVPPWISVLLGLIVMAIAGVLFQRLSKN